MDLATVINEAERDEMIWALLVEHADGRIECVSFDGSAGRVFDLEGTKREMAEWLLVPDPIPCDEAAAAEAPYFLDECPRCDLGN